MNFPSSLTSNNNNNSRRVMCISPVNVSKIKIQKELCPYNPFVMMVMLSWRRRVFPQSYTSLELGKKSFRNWGSIRSVQIYFTVTLRTVIHLLRNAYQKYTMKLKDGYSGSAYLR